MFADSCSLFPHTLTNTPTFAPITTTYFLHKQFAFAVWTSELLQSVYQWTHGTPVVGAVEAGRAQTKGCAVPKPITDYVDM